MTKKSADEVATIRVKYNDKYSYSSFSTVPNDTLGFTYSMTESVEDGIFSVHFLWKISYNCYKI